MFRAPLLLLLASCAMVVGCDHRQYCAKRQYHRLERPKSRQELKRCRASSGFHYGHPWK